MSAHDWFQRLLDVAGSKPLGGKVRQCPAHRDRSPSLSVRPGPDGSVRVTCFSGCSRDEILAALHCTRSRLAAAPRISPDVYAGMVGLKVEFPPVVLRTGHPSSRGYRLESVHDYGAAVLERWRSGTSKELVWETVKPDGSRVPGLFGVTLGELRLYREREIRQGIALGEPVLLVESESSVDALRGFFATTWAGGSTAVNVDRLRQVLGGYPHLVVIPDNDKAGLACLARLRAAGLGANVLMPGADEDARDLYRRLGPDGFDRAVRRTLAARAVGVAA